MNNELLTIFVGIIAICMILITVVIAVIGLQALNTIKRVHEFIDSTQNELSFLSTKAALTLHEASELIVSLKMEVHTLGAKSLSTLHELHEMLGYLHAQTKSLALKASNGIAKVTLGSLAIDALFNFFNKKKTK
ncbi:MAG: hypothetical protein PHX13_07135 [Thiovulaceae bacterium]|nr:hypothetical protein [Sulfurimonadaceae bacterium]